MWYVVFIFGVLSGCDLPGYAPADFTRPFKIVSIDGSRFRIYRATATATAIRVNFDFHARVGKIFPRAIKAMERVSGCQVVPGTAHGDSVVIRAALAC